METDDNRKLYELQEYDNDGGFPEPFQGVVKVQETSTGGKIQFVITIVQLVLLVLLLVAAIVILYLQLNANSCTDSGPASVTSNDRVFTDLANTSNNTQYAVKEVSQIMLAEIERRLNDTAMLNELIKTTDTSTQQTLSYLLNAISDVTNLANTTSDGVESTNEMLSNLVRLTEKVLLKIGANFDEEKEYQFNNTELLNRLLNGTSASASKLMHIVNTLSNLQDTSTSTAGVADDILLIAQELLELHNESAALPTSCKHLLEQQPLSPSGYYILAGPTGTYSTYCNMGTLCGSAGGWARLAYLDMTDAAQNCPSGLRSYQSGGVRVCGRTNSGAGCSNSITFPSNGISYSQICGRVTGYQYAHPNGIDGVNSLNSYYLEGVSITRGSPRQHVWSFIAEDTQSNCPCSSGNSGSVRSFMGTNWFCESGNPNPSWSYTLYTADPLWDGQGCGGSEGPCCNVPGMPWFHRDYGSTTTTDYLELRICADVGYSGEDSPVSFYEIYVK